MYNVKEGENCKTYCKFAGFCKLQGWDGFDPDECGMAYKIDDLLMDARFAAEEQEEEEDEE